MAKHLRVHIAQGSFDHDDVREVTTDPASFTLRIADQAGEWLYNWDHIIAVHTWTEPE